MNGPLGKIIAGFIILGGVVALVSIFMQWSKPKHESYNHPVTFHCERGHDFTMTVMQISDHQLKHYGAPIPCPVKDCKSIKLTRAGDPDPYAMKKPGGKGAPPAPKTP